MLELLSSVVQTLITVGNIVVIEAVKFTSTTCLTFATEH
jgi:hypothetical protein